jgi:hypothetical protein
MEHKTMNKNIFVIIGDIFRWFIALLILPVLLWLIFLFFMYPFEWLLSISTKWNLFFHILFWLFIGSIIIGFATSIGGLMSYLSKYLVRQTKIYAVVLFVALLALVGFCIYAAWSDYIDFSWEYLRYSTLNKIIFSFSVLGMLQIPMQIFGSTLEE